MKLFFFFTITYLITVKINKKKRQKNMMLIHKLENKKYSYNSKYHNFMKTTKCFEGDIPSAKISINAKVKKSLTIGICIKNCEKYCNSNFKIIKEICNLFESSNIIFYENGSDDNSLKILTEYCKENTHAIVISEEYQINHYPRTVRLARGRNICLNTAKNINNDIYIVLDFDQVITNLNVDSIAKCFNEKFEWGGLFANIPLGDYKGTYYDLWALRTYDSWMNYDCWEAKNIIGYKKAVGDHFKKIPKKSIIKVISAFCGLGIYNLSKVKHCYYYGWKNNRECCEHVHFNKQINKNNDLYIIGYLTNN